MRKLTSEAASLRVRVRELERALGDAGVALPLTSDNTFGRTDECWWVANAVGSLEIADDEEPNIAVSLRSCGLLLLLIVLSMSRRKWARLCRLGAIL